MLLGHFGVGWLTERLGGYWGLWALRVALQVGQWRTGLPTLTVHTSPCAAVFMLQGCQAGVSAQPRALEAQLRADRCVRQGPRGGAGRLIDVSGRGPEVCVRKLTGVSGSGPGEG